jgi:hypothetical protein
MEDLHEGRVELIERGFRAARASLIASEALQACVLDPMLDWVAYSIPLSVTETAGANPVEVVDDKKEE